MPEEQVYKSVVIGAERLCFEEENPLSTPEFPPVTKICLGLSLEPATGGELGVEGGEGAGGLSGTTLVAQFQDVSFAVLALAPVCSTEDGQLFCLCRISSSASSMGVAEIISRAPLRPCC